MDQNTLTLYIVASSLSFILSLALVTFAHFQSGTLVTRSVAAAIMVLSVAFFVAGYGLLLPRWMTVVGTNILLLSAGVILFTGFSAYCAQSKQAIDWAGWAIVVFAIFPFWYWGLVEPNGVNRSISFSLAAAILNVRTAWILVRHGSGKNDRPILVMGLLFATLALWMTVRGILLLNIEAVPQEQRAANPTSWQTVFGYVVLISLMTVGVLWFELKQLRANFKSNAKVQEWGSIEPVKANLILLWSTVIILSLAIVSEVLISYAAMYQNEEERLQKNAMQANDAFIESTLQIVGQVDILLNAARSYYQKVGTALETERFISSLGFNRELIDNIYIIDSNGLVLTPWSERNKGRNVSQRDYFLYHQQSSDDRVFIGAVQSGVVTGKKQFRITRRLNDAKGKFAGVVVAPIEPKAFSNYYRQLLSEKDSVVSLVGFRDHKLRARTPEPDSSKWDVPVDSPLWEALEKLAEGTYRNSSFIDNIERQFVFKRVGDFPLVMVVGFSDRDVHRNVIERIRPIAFGATFAVITLLALSWILTIVMRQRDDQDRFVSMLSHELKTPLSTISMTLGGGEIAHHLKQRIARSVNAMNAVIDRCVQSDRLSHGKIEIRLELCNIKTLINELITACATPDRISEQIDPNVSLTTDRQLLAVVLSNLIDNALKYSPPESQISLRIEFSSSLKNSGFIFIVSNLLGSAGMPDAQQIFKKYYRAPGAHGKIGSGLGLHIADGFAKKMGGRLRYRPSTDKVNFELWIPT